MHILCILKKEGNFPNERFYTDKSLVYVGEYIGNYTTGFGDGASGYWLFRDDKGEKRMVIMDYEGKTAFKEVP